jgi:hypothetical protein
VAAIADTADRPRAGPRWSSRESRRIWDQSAGGLVVAKTVAARDSAVRHRPRAEFQGDGVRVCSSAARGAALGAGLGLALTLLARWRRRS